VDAGNARDAADRLRFQLDRTSTAAQLSLDACTKHSATLRAVLDESVEEYRQMGAAAAGHASDVQTLVEAWPKP
jgi:chemotaxis regulatin CheY-phosphate phosphatase CheZ